MDGLSERLVRVERDLEALDRLIDNRFDEVERALNLARETQTAKFENVNEWRQTYADLTAKKVDRGEFTQFTRSVLAVGGLLIAVATVIVTVT